MKRGLVYPTLAGEAYYRRLLPIACEKDLEDIVATHKHAAYGKRWFKIRNPGYSQYERRRELFERKRTAVVAPVKSFTNAPVIGRR